MSRTSGLPPRVPSWALALLLMVSLLTFPPTAPRAEASTAAKQGTTLGSTSYSAQSGSIYVSPQGNDSDPGTVGSPVRTLERGLALASAGGTVVLRAGTYHESVVLKKKVTIQNHPGEIVWLDGSSPVINWSRSGSVWVAPWSTFFGIQKFHGGVRSDYPNANRTDQVFVDGKALTEVGSSADVKAGTFFADIKNKQLMIGSDPTGKSVSASTLAFAIEASASDVTLRGFGVRRYASTTPNGDARGAVIINTAGGTLEHLVVSDNSALGIELSGDRKIVRNVVAERNGMVGLDLHKANDSKISDSVFDANNSEFFPREPAAAAAKITKSDGAIIDNNTFSNTRLAAGLWFDMFSRNVTVVNNDFSHNGAMQLNLEAVLGGVVANNKFTGGTQGVVSRDSESISLVNNKFGSYTVQAINLAQDERWSSKPVDTPSDFSLRTRNVLVANNVFACGTRFQIFANDESRTFAADQFNLNVTGNLFSPQQKSPELNLAYWGAGSSGIGAFIQKTTELNAKGPGWKNIQATNCTENPETAYSSAELTASAHPLPTEVAKALGIPAGSKTIGLVNPGNIPSVNSDPIARFSVAAAGLTARFDGAGSSDSDGNISRYAWEFGDGTSSSGVTVDHQYAEAGSFKVTLTVTDDKGASSSASRTITVENPPQPVSPQGPVAENHPAPPQESSGNAKPTPIPSREPVTDTKPAPSN